MIDVNVSNLKDDIANLEILIQEYEEIKLNLFNRLKDSTIDWVDSKSVKFSDAIYLDKQETEVFIQSLKDKKDMFKFIYEKYIKLGKQIKCNLDGQKTIIGNIDDCIGQIDSIIEEFDKIKIVKDERVQSMINYEKNRARKVREYLKSLKKDIIKIFGEIEEIEKSINVKISSLEVVRINEFDFEDA